MVLDIKVSMQLIIQLHLLKIGPPYFILGCPRTLNFLQKCKSRFFVLVSRVPLEESKNTGKHEGLHQHNRQLDRLFDDIEPVDRIDHTCLELLVVGCCLIGVTDCTLLSTGHRGLKADVSFLFVLGAGSPYSEWLCLTLLVGGY